MTTTQDSGVAVDGATTYERRLRTALDRLRYDLGREPSDGELEILRQKVHDELIIEAVRRAGEKRPDFSGTFNPPGIGDRIDWIIAGLMVPKSTTGLIAPTSVGGSTLELNVIHSMLTGKPLFGVYDVNVPDGTKFLWLNPEEAPETPRARLRNMGIPADVVRERVVESFVRDQRIQFNNPLAVEAYIEDAAPLLEDADEVIIFIDGAAMTIRGTLWNEDFEAWKDGVGKLKVAVGSSLLVARSQVTGESARLNRKTGADIEMEDAKGAQFAEWPDQRFVYQYGRRWDGEGQKRKARVDLSHRRLRVRGRMVVEQQIDLGYDERTGLLTAQDVSQKVVAQAEVSSILAGKDDLFNGAVTSGNVDPSSQRNVAAYLAERRARVEAPIEVSEDTYRRVLADLDWAGGWQTLVQDPGE